MRATDPYLVGGPAFEAPRLVHVGKHWLVMVPREMQPPTSANTRGKSAHDGPRLGPWHLLLVARGNEEDTGDEAHDKGVQGVTSIRSSACAGDAPQSVRSAESEAYRECNELRAQYDRMIAMRGTSWSPVDAAECWWQHRMRDLVASSDH